MTKQDLLDELKAERGIVITALNFSYIVASRAWESQFQTYTLSEGVIDLEMDSSSIRYVIPRPADLIPLYTAPDVLEQACFNLVRVTLRNAVTQHYEKIQSFCLGDSIKQPKWELASWRQCARLARNSMSHDFILNFWDQKKKQLRSDVTFTFPSGNTIEIKNSQHGQAITGDNMPLNSIIELLDVMKDFVEKEL